MSEAKPAKVAKVEGDRSDSGRTAEDPKPGVAPAGKKPEPPRCN